MKQSSPYLSITITYVIHYVFLSRVTSTVTMGPLAIDPFSHMGIDIMEEEEMAQLGLGSGQPADPPRTTVQSTVCTVTFTIL